MGLFSNLKKLSAQVSQPGTKHLMYNDALFAALPDSIAEVRKLMREADESAAPAISKGQLGISEFNKYIYKKTGMKKADDYHEDARRTCLYKIYCLGRTRFTERTTDDNAADGEWSTAAFLSDMLALGEQKLLVGSVEETAARNAFYMDFSSVVKQFSDLIIDQVMKTGKVSLPEPIMDVYLEIGDNINFWSNFIRDIYRGEGRYNPNVRAMISAFFNNLPMDAGSSSEQLWDAYFEVMKYKDTAKNKVQEIQQEITSYGNNVIEANAVDIVKKYLYFYSMNYSELGKTKELDMQIYKEAADHGNMYALYLYGKLLAEEPNPDIERVMSCIKKASAEICGAYSWMCDYWDEIAKNGPLAKRKNAEKKSYELGLEYFERTQKIEAELNKYASIEL